MSRFFPGTLDFGAVAILKEFFLDNEHSTISIGDVAGAAYHLEGFALGQWFGASDAPKLSPPSAALTITPSKSPEYCLSILTQFEALAEQHTRHEKADTVTTVQPVGAFDWGFVLTLALQVTQELLRRLVPTPTN